MITKNIKLLCVGLIVALLSACSNVATKGPSPEELYPLLFQEKPRSILVLPAINESTAADAPDYYSVTIAPMLTSKGYYVMPQEITTQVLQSEGITDGKQLLGISLDKFQQLFGADAVLFVTIKEWDTNYYVLGGNMVVSAIYELKSTKTGETLWANAARKQVSTSGDSNSGGGLLGAIIATAIKTATTDYMPIAKEVNAYAVSTLPVGSYHPQHVSNLARQASLDGASDHQPQTVQ